MSIAEKLTQVAENQQAVFNAGYAAGMGGVQFLTGTFIPVEATDSVTLEFDKSISNVIIVQSVPTLGLGYGIHYVSCHISGFTEFYAHSNLAGNSWSSVTPGNSLITIADDGMSLIATTPRNWGTVEHKWIAW